jgi:Peptidase A4 family
MTKQSGFVGGDTSLRPSRASGLWPGVVVLIFFLPVAAIVAATVLAAISQSTATLRLPDAKFAGYLWRGAVSSVGGSWTVPRILSGSPAGRAATWIGAEGEDVAGSFIQIGVEEIRRGGRDLYIAVWSDRRLHELLHPLFVVNGGDDVSARLAWAPGRWQLSIHDLTARHGVSFSTRDEANGLFIQAEWIQEDPPESVGGKGGPYPHLTAVAFRSLQVNAARPGSVGLKSFSMSATGSHFGPGPVRGDGFIVRRTG